MKEKRRVYYKNNNKDILKEKSREYYEINKDRLKE